MKNILTAMKNRIDKWDIISFLLLFLGLFVHLMFFVLLFCYFIISALIDIYKVYKTAWDNPKDKARPLLNNRGFGIPILSFLSGGLIWLYLDSFGYFSSSISMITSVFFIAVLIPSIFSAIVTVLSIELIQRYKIKKYDLEV